MGLPNKGDKLELSVENIEKWVSEKYLPCSSFDVVEFLLKKLTLASADSYFKDKTHCMCHDGTEY